MINTEKKCDQPMIITDEDAEKDDHLQQTPQIGYCK